MVRLVILLSAVIAAASILIVYIVLKKKDKNIYSILMTAFSIFAALLFGVYQALPKPTPPSPPPSPPVTTSPPPSAPIPTAPTPVSEPQSLYGRALKRSVTEHVYYEDWEKANIITETYYDPIMTASMLTVRIKSGIRRQNTTTGTQAIPLDYTLRMDCSFLLPHTTWAKLTQLRSTFGAIKCLPVIT